MEKNGRVGQDIWKRRILRFGFDDLKLRNFQLPVKNKATWMPRRCVIYMPQMPNSHECIHTYGNKRYRGCVIHIGVGLMRCSFRQVGQCEGLRSWSERQCRASRLNRNIKLITLIIKYTITGTLWIDTIKFPLFFLFSQGWYFIDMRDSWSVSQKIIGLPIKNRKILLTFA